MFKRSSLAAVAFICASLAGTLWAEAPVTASQNDAGRIVPNRYIVSFATNLTFAPPLDRAARLRAMREETADAVKRVFPRPSRNASPKVLWAGNAVAVTLSPAEAESARRNPAVESVVPVEDKCWLEPEVAAATGTLTVWGVPRTGAPDVWEKYKIDGSGVVVGHLDSGVFADHPALQGQILGFRDFTATAPAVAYDDNGHGTHTAGTIAGKTDGIGMAPGSMLLVARILNAQGGGSTEAIFSAMQWMLDPDGNPETDDAPRVVNNSWGSSATTDRTFWKIVQTWVDAGIVPVFAAGNNGYANGKVGVPAAFPHALAVGATDRSDAWAYFSSLGPAVWDGKTFVKPDVAAPGAQIISASKDGGLTNNSGTSMAAPHAAGFVALLLQANPTLTVSQIMDIARSTALDLGTAGPDTKFGFGRIDAVKAVEKALVMASPTARLQGMMARLATGPDHRMATGRDAFSERAVRAMIPAMLSLPDREWAMLANSWSASSRPVERQVSRYLSSVRRFRAVHREAGTGRP